MKKLLTALSLLFFAVGLTGCVSGETHVKINEDGSAKVTSRMLMDKGMAAMGEEEDPMENLKEKAKKDGWTFEELNKDGMIGGKVSKTFDSYEEIEFIGLGENEDESSMETKFDVKVNEGFFKTTYTLDGRVDASNTLDEMMEEEKQEEEGNQLFSEDDMKNMYRSMLGRMDLKWKLTLPVEAEEQNADKVSGKTLTWNIDMMGDNKFHAKAEQLNTTNIILTVVVATAAAGALGVFVFSLRKRRKQ